LTTAAGFSLDFNASDGMPLEDYSKLAIQSHKDFRSSSSTANSRMSLSSLMARRRRIKLNGTPQAFVRLHHAARGARITGKLESDHGNLGMHRLRAQQNGFRLLNAFGASNRIGET